MPDERKIRVIRPDGKVSTIPLSSLPDAIRRKYRPADGSFLPSEPDAKSPLSWENQHPAAGVGRALWGTLSTPFEIWKAGLPTKENFQRGTALMNPAEIMVKMAKQQMDDTASEARGDIKAGRKAEGRAKAVASGIPVLGPMAASLGKTAGTGDVTGAGTEALTYAALPKIGEFAGKGFRAAIPEGSGTQAATRPIVQKYLFDRSMSVQNMISKAAKTFDDMIGQRWQRIEKTVDSANPGGVIDASRLRATTEAAKKELIATPQKLPSAVQTIASKGEAPRVMGSRLDLSNPIHKGLYDRLVEEGALPSADTISWQEARQVRSKLGRELRGHSPLSGEAKALGWRMYDELTNQMRESAERYGMGNDFDVANKLHQQYMQDFVDRQSPLAKAIKGKNPHGILDPLSNPRFAEQARRIMAKYQDLGIKPELISKEGNLFQKYKSGLPKQWEANRWEYTADPFTGGVPTGVRLTHNLLSRAKALRELQTPNITSSVSGSSVPRIEPPPPLQPTSSVPIERPPTPSGESIVRPTERQSTVGPRDSAKAKVDDFLTQAFIRKTQEMAGQDVLDTMTEKGESPIEVNRVFWDQTFDNLPPEVQRRFTKYLKKETGGMEPGDAIGVTKDRQPIIAKSWADIANNILDLDHDPEMLEGTTRGLVVLMRIALEKFKPGASFRRLQP